MPARIVEGQLPYTGGTGIEIDTNKVISILLREENNLIMVNSDNEVYTDLQLQSGLTPSSDFPVGVTTGKVLQSDGWEKSGLILNWKTTSGDYARWIYATDGKIYFDNGTGTWNQVYYSSEVDNLLLSLRQYVDSELAKKQNGVTSATAPANPVQGDLWYDTNYDILKVFNGSQWVVTGGGGGTGDVVGPNSSVDGNIAVFDGTTGKIIKDGNISLSTLNNKVDTNTTNIGTNTNDIATINGKIPSAATTSNQLADKAYVNDSINSITAYYITKNAQGDQFATYAELAAATTFYSGGVVRVPTRNDYCIVLDDENHDHACTRYIYQNNQWEFQYIVNETALTQAQLDALNSGITSAKVSTYDGYATTKQNTLATQTAYTSKGTATKVPQITTNTLGQVTNITEVTITQQTVNDGALTIQKNGTAVQTFSANQGTNAIANITVPTDTGDLTNGAGFLTSSTGVTSVNGNHGAVTVNDVKVGNTAPSNPTDGIVWYDTDLYNLQVYNGSTHQWDTLNNIFHMVTPGVGDDMADYINILEDSGSRLLMFSFNENMSDLWIVTDYGRENWDEQTQKYENFKITAIGNVSDNADTTFIQDWGLTRPKGIATLEIIGTYQLDTYVCSTVQFKESGGLKVAPNSPITGIKYVWYGTEADYANLSQYYTDVPGDTEFHCF